MLVSRALRASLRGRHTFSGARATYRARVTSALLYYEAGLLKYYGIGFD